MTTAKHIPGIFERFRPWPVNIVAPLPSVPPPIADVEPPAVGTALE